jgi:hypothetical protein
MALFLRSYFARALTSRCCNIETALQLVQFYMWVSSYGIVDTQFAVAVSGVSSAASPTVFAAGTYPVSSFHMSNTAQTFLNPLIYFLFKLVSYNSSIAVG